MSTIKSSAENLTLNADGANNDIKFQSNGVEKASIDQDGLFIANKLKVGTADNGTITSTFALALDPPSGEPILFRNNGTDIARFRPGGGLCFGTDSAAANALDDYEEGAWTPTIIAKSSNPSVTYGHQHGYYTKVGNLVTAVFRVYVGAGGISGGSGDGQVGGLPYTTKGHTDGQGGLGSVNMNAVRYEGTYSAGRNSVDIMLQENSSTMDIRQFKPETPGSLHTGLGITQIDDGLFNFEGSVIYLT